MSKLFFHTTAIALVMSSMTSTAFAQEDEAEVKTLDRVTVTAQRVEQDLQDVPVSLTAVDGAELTERNINEITQLTLAAPTLQVGQDNTFAVRGIGSQVFAQTIDPSVALAVDGVSLARNVMAGLPFNDVASVEVLNGPQGLLFGKNASAGLVNITTKRPQIGELSGSIGTELVVRNTTPGDATGRIFRGTANLPVGEDSAFRLNGLYSYQDSIIDNVFDNSGVREDLDQERWGLNGRFLHEQGPFSVYVIADYGETSGTGGRFGRTMRSIDPASSLDTVIAANGIVAGPENLVNDSDGPMFSDETVAGISGTLEYELENGIQLINIAAYRNYTKEQDLHSDFTSSLGITRNANSSDFDQISNELRMVIPANDRFSGQFGVYYFNFDASIDSELRVAGGPPAPFNAGFPFCVDATDVVPGAPPPTCSVSNVAFLGSDADTSLEQTSYALYGQFDFFLTDRFTMTVGGRVTDDEVSSTVVQGQQNYFVNIGGPSGTFSETVENTNFSWKIGGQYDVTEDVMIYASIGSGYKAPGFNTENQDNPAIPFAVQDEVSTTFEAGLRSVFMDDKVTLNVSVFNTEFDNYQSQSFFLEEAGTGTFILQNAASVTSRGAEASLSALLSDNFSVFWDVALLDSTFDEFPGVQCTSAIDASLCAPGQETFDASGIATPLAADVTSTLQGLYEYDINDSVQGFVQGSMYYRSDINFNVASPLTELDAITTFNLSAGFELENGLRASIFCKNCTDEKAPTGIALDPGENADGLATTNQTWGLDSVRTIGIDLTKRF